MRKSQAVFIVLLSLVLGACTAAAAPTTPYEVNEVPSVGPASPTVEVEAVDSCIACHIDRQRLISTAKPVEATEGESKGVG